MVVFSRSGRVFCSSAVASRTHCSFHDVIMREGLIPRGIMSFIVCFVINTHEMCLDLLDFSEPEYISNVFVGSFHPVCFRLLFCKYY